MPTQERRVSIDTVNLLKVIGVLAVLAFLWLIRDILALVFAALFLSALLNPAATYLETKKIPKGVTVVVLYILLIGISISAVGLLLPTLLDQGTNLLHSVSKSWVVISREITSLKELSDHYGLLDNFQGGIQSLQEQFSGAATGIFTTVTNFFGGLIGLVVVLVMAYYMVAQEDEARRAFHNFVPEEYQEILSNILSRVQEKMSRWLLGQLSLCLIIGVMYYIGLSVVGVDAALVLALFGGFTEFIPYVGPILGSIPVVLIALSDSPFKALLALIVVVVIQQAEGHIIVPKVMQKAVGLNPLVSITALLVGAKLFGIVGALMAIPVVTAVSVIVSELYRTRLHAE